MRDSGEVSDSEESKGESGGHKVVLGVGAEGVSGGVCKMGRVIKGLEDVVEGTTCLLLQVVRGVLVDGLQDRVMVCVVKT